MDNVQLSSYSGLRARNNGDKTDRSEKRESKSRVGTTRVASHSENAEELSLQKSQPGTSRGTGSAKAEDTKDIAKFTAISMEDMSNLVNDAVFCVKIDNLTEAEKEKFGLKGAALRGGLLFLGAWAAASNVAGFLAPPIDSFELGKFAAVISSVGVMYTFALGKTAMEVWKAKKEKGGVVPYLKDSVKNPAQCAMKVASIAWGVSSVYLDRYNAEIGAYALAGQTKSTATPSVQAYAYIVSIGNGFVETILPAYFFQQLAMQYVNNIKGLVLGDNVIRMGKEQKTFELLKAFDNAFQEEGVRGANLSFNRTTINNVLERVVAEHPDFHEVLSDLQEVLFDKGRLEKLVKQWVGLQAQTETRAAVSKLRTLANLVNARKAALVHLTVDTCCILVAGMGFGLLFAATGLRSHYQEQFDQQGWLTNDTDTWPFGYDCSLLQNMTIDNVGKHDFNMKVFSYYQQGATFSVFPLALISLVSFCGKTLFSDCDANHLKRYLSHLLGGLCSPAGIVGSGFGALGCWGYYQLVKNVDKDVDEYAALLDCDIGVPSFGIVPNTAIANLAGFAATWLLMDIVFHGAHNAWKGVVESLTTSSNPEALELGLVVEHNRNAITEPTFTPVKHSNRVFNGY